MNRIIILIVQYPKLLKFSVVIFKEFKIGLPMYDAVDPVTAKTISITTICQLECIPQRSFNFFN